MLIFYNGVKFQIQLTEISHHWPLRVDVTFEITP